jgi:endonuclease YncB( thermonuclease family)
MKKIGHTALLILLLLAGKDVARANPVQIVDVFSGDTLSVSMGGDTLSIRLYGIDAPESGQHGNVAATRFLKRLLRNQAVRVEWLHADGLAPPLAILVRDGKESSVNAAMVANGYAWVYPRHCTIDICSQWKQLEAKARMFGLGIWSGFDLLPPWEFNRRQGD